MMEWDGLDTPIVMEIRVTGSDDFLILNEQSVYSPDFEQAVEQQCMAIRLFMEQERQQIDKSTNYTG